jgi:hypothetical protein
MMGLRPFGLNPCDLWTGEYAEWDAGYEEEAAAQVAAALRQPDIDAELRKLIAEFGRDAVMTAIERLESEEPARG